MSANIPLNLRLRKGEYKTIAYAQDIIVGELYNYFPDAIIHGGTAIWRCYSGNRFSYDVDVYIIKDTERIEQFSKALEAKGFRVFKKRIRDNSVYIGLEFNGAETKFEATFQKKKPFTKKYETSESFFINVLTLTAEDLVIEKVETYLSRKKIRDLYDIYFLLSYVEDRNAVLSHLKKLIDNYKKPLDEGNLAEIILIGAVPSSENLLKGIIKWAK